MSLNSPQPAPAKGCRDIGMYVLLDVQERMALGAKKYGTPLQANNGRDALVDAYQEALDLVFYLRQAIMERQLERESRNALPTLPAKES